MSPSEEATRFFEDETRRLEDEKRRVDEQIAQRITGLRALEALLQDPEYFELACRYVDARRDATSDNEPGAPRRGAVVLTGLKSAVREACKLFASEYDVYEVLKGLEVMGYKTKADNPRKAVTTILSALAEDKEIELVSQGKGGKPSVYRNKPQ